MKTFFRLREELLREEENKAITQLVNKHTQSKAGDNIHLSTHGTQHIYSSGHSDEDSHVYHVHDTSTGKTHTVGIEHGGETASHKDVRKAATKEVSDASVKAIHKDHKEEMSGY